MTAPAPSLTHMEKALAIWHARNAPSLTERIARALAAEHDAALEKAAVECDERKVLNDAVESAHMALEGESRATEARECAAAIRAMKNGEGR